jgi:hypothetical protein
MDKFNTPDIPDATNLPGETGIFLSKTAIP